MPGKVSPQQWRVLRALTACRTGALGIWTYHCQDCGRLHAVACGCGNRHCPQCQGRLARRWLEQQQSRLLEVPYFHLVFTLPHELNPLVRQNRAVTYELLLESASQTLLAFGRNRFGGDLGITMVLHTWGQRLLEHYHVHAIVTGGAWSLEGGWRQVPNANYLFNITALSVVFRGKFCDGLQQLRRSEQLAYHGQQAALSQETVFQGMMRKATENKWVVYAKKPFAGPQTVLRYLSNYTHRVGITSGRIEQLDARGHRVRFRYRDYARDSRIDSIELDTGEFVRRFSLHILPPRFTKVRHYGLLANRGRARRLETVRAAIAQAQGRKMRVRPALKVQPLPTPCCPYCHSPRLRLVSVFRPWRRRSPRLDSS